MSLEHEPHVVQPQAGGLHRALERLLASDAPFRRSQERLLVELTGEDADELMMLTKESRGAWAVLLAGRGGRALICGNALSGTSVALATLGWDVTVVDRSHTQARFAARRAEDLVPGTTTCVVAGSGTTLPFVDQAFDVVVCEGGLPSPATGWGFDAAELRRVAREELFVASDNRLGYKRSTGRRGAFLRRPTSLLKEIVSPLRGERALPSTRHEVLGNWQSVDTYALYPHAREFSHVVALDAPTPRLTIGPRERKNRLKMLGKRLGLFRWLTPSFGVHARRSAGRTSRLDRILGKLAEHTGEPRPRVDMLIGTRSNDALIHTAIPGADPDDPAGRWTLHVPLQPAKRRMVGVHHGWLTRLRTDSPSVPVPEPLFHGELDGIHLAVERRVAGQNGTDLTGDLPRTAAMFDDAATHFAELLERAPTSLSHEAYDALLDARFERVRDLIATLSTARRVRHMADALRERWRGEPIRLGVYHADLRSKHVQVDASGRVLGYLDWGASEERFLPLSDLMHLIVHQRKQETGSTFGAAWQSTRRAKLRREHENAAIERYAALADLDPTDVDALFDAYPILVAGMAERNWDYSRPDWVARQFELL